MGAGKFRHTITIETYTQAVTNQFNERDYEDDDNWETHLTTHAEIKPINSKETLRNGIINHDVTHTVTIRYESGINTRQRIKFGSRIFHVDSVINLYERSRELMMVCKEAS